MKKCIALASCLLLFGTSFAQRTKTPDDPATAQRKLVAMGRCAIAGNFTDGRNHPIAGVKLFVYLPDTSIIASGFSSESGHYETNSISKGTYTVKIVYPNLKTIMVPGVIMKPGYTPLSIKADEPSSDTVIVYPALLPETG